MRTVKGKKRRNKYNASSSTSILQGGERLLILTLTESETQLAFRPSGEAVKMLACGESASCRLAAPPQPQPTGDNNTIWARWGNLTSTSHPPQCVMFSPRLTWFSQYGMRHPALKASLFFFLSVCRLLLLWSSSLSASSPNADVFFNVPRCSCPRFFLGAEIHHSRATTKCFHPLKNSSAASHYCFMHVITKCMTIM